MLVAGRRRGRVLARRADHDRAARRARLPDPVVPPDDQGLPVGRRRLHRHPDNFGLLPAQVAASRCSPTTSSPSRCRSPPAPPRWRRRSRALRRTASRSPSSSSLIIAYGNLRASKESGKVFAVPTYFFIVNMVILLGVGVVRAGRPAPAGGHDRRRGHGARSARSAATACSWAPRCSWCCKAFASGGAAVTGVEAISNGVPAFKEPAWKNARKTLVVMGSLLGFMFLGLSMLAARTHAMPYDERHADGDLPDRQARVRRARRSATCCSTRCRPARC